MSTFTVIQRVNKPSSSSGVNGGLSLSPISIIDYPDKDEYAGTSYEGFIDRQPDYLTATHVKSGLKYTVTKEGVTELVEIKADKPIDTNKPDGNYTIWGDSNGNITLGYDMKFKPTQGDPIWEYMDPMPTGTYSSTTTWSGWEGRTYRLFNRTYATSSDGVLLSNPTSNPWVKVVFPEVKLCRGVSLSDIAPLSVYGVKDFTLMYSATESSPTEVLLTGTMKQYDNTVFTFPEVEIKSLMMIFNSNYAGGGSYTHLTAIDLFYDYVPAFNYPYYNITSGSLFNSDGDVVKMCPIGTCVVENNVITQFNCFYKGTECIIPINDGNSISKGTAVLNTAPFYSRQASNLNTFLLNGTNWEYTGQANNGWGTLCLIKGSDIKFTYLASGIPNQNYNGSSLTANFTTDAKFAAAVKRGF